MNYFMKTTGYGAAFLNGLPFSTDTAGQERLRRISGEKQIVLIRFEAMR